MLQRPRTVSSTFAAGLVACRINHYPSPDHPDATCRRTPASARQAWQLCSNRRRKRRQRIGHIVASWNCLLTSTSARCVSPKAGSAGRHYAECVLQYLHAQHGLALVIRVVNSQQLICQFSRRVRVSASRTSAIAIGSMISNVLPFH